MPVYYVKYEDWADSYAEETEAGNSRLAAQKFTRKLDAEEQFIGARHFTPERVVVSRNKDMSKPRLYIVQCSADYRARREE